MKKVMAFVMGLLLCLYALSASAVSISWSDAAPAAQRKGWQGRFVTLDPVALQMWIREDMQPLTLGEAERQQGFIAYYLNEDGSSAVGVTLIRMDTTFEKMLGMLQANGYTDASENYVNGIRCILYTMPAAAGFCNVVNIVTADGYVMELIFSAANEELVYLSGIMSASLQVVRQ